MYFLNAACLLAPAASLGGQSWGPSLVLPPLSAEHPALQNHGHDDFFPQKNPLDVPLQSSREKEM